MIDFEILKDIPKEELAEMQGKIKKKFAEIEKSLNEYLDLYEEIRDLRNQAFSRDITPAELKKYGSKTGLPGNVIFKFIERYHYVDLAKKIRRILGDDKKLTKNEYMELTSSLKTGLLNTESTTFMDVFKDKCSVNNIFKGKIEGRGDMQHKEKKRHQQIDAGLKGHGTRESLKMLANQHRNDPRKAHKKVDAAKGASKVIHVKQGSPDALLLAKKYRIADPRGKKVVAGNQNSEGVTIFFEETLDQKVARAQKALSNK